MPRCERGTPIFIIIGCRARHGPLPRKCCSASFQPAFVCRLEACVTIYLNFEDERLTLTSAQLRLILEAYYELYPENYGQEIYLFFDEIQEINGWEKFVRRMYDTVRKNIFLTGSSAKMLWKEIATSLRGRDLVYHLFPFSFEEYCRFQNLDVKDVYSTHAGPF
ncbi:MAG: AAA family ATPase [candidate division KSB1 bacterium]|nr:AAA family ATPase [candidate division KSB1 bacterium]MDZ7366693.1 AAA family ATPase [candidate division KSB1 bacterium]MDZ7404706.1 AAA family ATPase [candidate division KSB1 bacterium]